MRKWTRIAGWILLAGMTGGCGGGGEEGLPVAGALGPALEQQLQFCALARTGDLAQILRRVQALLTAAADPAAAEELGVEIAPSDDPGDPPFTYGYSISFDLDGNGSEDATVSGKITFGADPTAGLSVGSTAELSWMLSGAEGNVTGEGSFDLLLAGAGTIEVSGSGSIRDARDGCVFDVTIDPAMPLLIRTPLEAAQGPSPAQVITIELDGCLRLHLEIDQVTFTSEVCIDGEQVCYSDVEFNGQSLPDRCLQLLPITTPGFLRMAACAALQVTVLTNLAKAVLLGESSADLDGDGRRETLTAEFDNFNRLQWTIRGSVTGEGFFFPGGLTVTNASGGFSVGACSVVISIVPGGDAGAPLVLAFGSESDPASFDVYGGIDRFVVRSGEDFLTFAVGFEEGGDGVGAFIVAGSVDGESVGGHSISISIPGT